MAVKIKTKNGTIDVSNDVIATVVGGAATDNYGVVEMGSPSMFTLSLDMVLKFLKYQKMYNQKLSTA